MFGLVAVVTVNSRDTTIKYCILFSSDEYNDIHEISHEELTPIFIATVLHVFLVNT